MKTEMMVCPTHKELVEQGVRWLRQPHNRKDFTHYQPACGVVISELVSLAESVPDVLGFGSNWSIVIECKISRTDFFADRKKCHREHINQPGNYRYYLTPENLVTVDELPEGWGLLYSNGKQIKEQKIAPRHEGLEVRAAEFPFLYSVARRATLQGLVLKKKFDNPIHKATACIPVEKKP